jgi:outer membrane protein insertion porin family
MPSCAGAMKKTRRKNWYNPFGASKFIAKTYKVDKENLINEYNEAGYRNATIVRDTTYFVNDRKLMVEIDVEEGNKFYFRDIYFTATPSTPPNCWTS